MRRLKKNKKGVSTVVGSMLFLIIIIMLASTLFLGLYGYNNSAQEAIILEEARAEEKIVIDELVTDAEVTEITAINVKNVGSSAVRIRAIYVDNTLIYDPLTYIDAKQDALLTLPDPTPYTSTSIITAATERGVKSTIEEGDLIENYQTPLDNEFYFGPLKLDFEEFYYIQVLEGTYDPTEIEPGWNPDSSTTLVWRITVTNIDSRTINLTKYSCLTLIDNAGGSQRPWYIEKIEHETGPDSSSILPQETVNIFYRWDNPISQKHQSVFSNDCQCRVILTFFGSFDLSGDRTIPYGQTIPFEAVLIDK